ncbi:MAG: 2-amino-4-hydroxy-6-hydroxymethyldihydropteridine diphosphokinase [Tannerellaceae bacterium]
MNRIVLGLGSNRDSIQNIERATARLRAHFVSIRFSEAVYTEPINCLDPALFLNIVAVAESPDGPEEVRSVLKDIEYALGRRPEDKAAGRILIDIDLLQWNDRILKPDDLEREYIRAGLHSLLASGQ